MDQPAVCAEAGAEVTNVVLVRILHHDATFDSRAHRRTDVPHALRLLTFASSGPADFARVHRRGSGFSSGRGLPRVRAPARRRPPFAPHAAAVSGHAER